PAQADVAAGLELVVLRAGGGAVQLDGQGAAGGLRVGAGQVGGAVDGKAAGVGQRPALGVDGAAAVPVEHAGREVECRVAGQFERAVDEHLPGAGAGERARVGRAAVGHLQGRATCHREGAAGGGGGHGGGADV